MTCPICGLESRVAESEAQLRLDAITRLVRQLRQDHRGNDLIGDVCDLVELRAWGPTLIDRPFTVPGDSNG